MTDVVTNLKVRFGADTRQFKKGTNEGKKAVKQFTGDATNNLNNFANVFGVNMGAVSQHMRTVKAGTTLMGNGFKGAATSSNVFGKALKFLKVALIGTGIGAIVVALGSLIAYFTKTQRGANKLSKIMAGFKAIVGVIVDRFSALGEKVFWAFSHPKEAIVELWETLKKNIINRVNGIINVFKGLGKVIGSAFDLDFDGVKKAAGETGTALAQIVTGLDEEGQKKAIEGIKGLTKEIKEEASAAVKLQDAQNKLERQEVNLIESLAKRRAEIDKLRLAAKDETKTAEERKEALKKAAALEMSILNDQKKMQQEKVRILAAQQALGENMLEDDRELAQEKAKLAELESATTKKLLRLKTEENTLDKQIAKEATDRIKKKYTEDSKLAENERKLTVAHAERRAEMERLKCIADDESKTEKERSEALKKSAKIEASIIKDQIELQKQKLAALKAIKAESKGSIDNNDEIAAATAKLVELESNYSRSMYNIAKSAKDMGKDIKAVVIDFAGVINDSMKDLTIGFGEQIGGLLAGVGEMQSFSALVADTFGQMAIQVGKIAIGTGIAVMGIKEALMSLNPVAAIAGGVALIALGKWVKSSLSSVANGGGSGGYSGNSGYLSGNVDATSKSKAPAERAAQVVHVEVGGEFKMKNNTLVAAVQAEQRRKGIVT